MAVVEAKVRFPKWYVSMQLYSARGRENYAAAYLKVRWFRKDFLVSSISPKKRTNEFVFTTMRIVFVRFLEEIDNLKKPFRN